MNASFHSFKLLLFAGVIISFSSEGAHAQFFKKLKDQVKQTVEETASNHAANDAGNATDSAITKTENAAGKAVKGKKDNNPNNSRQPIDNSNSSSARVANNPSADNSTAVVTSSADPTLQTYQNYDFVPGDTILFADDFADDQKGELPAHWKLDQGQGSVNTFDGKNVFALTKGDGGDNSTVIDPRMKTKAGYLPQAFTVEFDMYVPNTTNTSGTYDNTTTDDINNNWVGLNFYSREGDEESFDYSNLSISPQKLEFYQEGLTTALTDFDLPENNALLNFVSKWHHVAIAYRDKQMKIYLDQNRIYVIQEVKNPALNKFGLRLAGKCVVTNVRIAEGGGMNMVGKKFTDAKIITHGINFDIDKSTIKPESMGTLNMIVGILKDNPDLKFEIDGHTDNTGQSAHNLTLSQQRADAVKAQLASMGIEASRLTTKGFGDSKPISDNSSPEGKANNRRVEFVKM